MTYVPPIYPNDIPTITEIFGYTDDIDWIEVVVWDAMRKELVACLETLGTNPEGAYADVDARIQALEDAPAGDVDKIHDADNDTAVETERTADKDHVEMKTAGNYCFDMDENGILSLVLNSASRVGNPSAQLNIPDATPTKVILSSEDHDIQSEFADSKFTAKTAGIYLIHGQINYKYNSLIVNKVYGAKIYINGVMQNYSTAHAVVNNLATFSVQTSIVKELAVNDYVELYAHLTVGAGTVDIAFSSGQKYTYLSVTKIS